METGYLQVGDARLFFREVGEGHPIVVLHGGPDFDHTYLLPELDRLADSYRIVYYDQRGRGRSAAGVQPEDVTLDSEIEDIDAVRHSFELETMAVLGHSWGCVLALEYAIRHPERVSYLILLNAAPASRDDLLLLRRELGDRRSPEDAKAMATLAGSDGYREGDAGVEAHFYRLHFKPGLHRMEHVDEIVGRLRTHFTPETILLARAIEHRLYDETWLREDYDLLPKLRELDVPTLVLHGEHDLIPVEVAKHAADAIPRAQLSVLPECGHFAYLEAPDGMRRNIDALFAGTHHAEG